MTSEEREKYPSEKAERFQIRLPEGMRDNLKEMAAMSGRSMNSEIVDRLEKSMRGWPNVELPPDLYFSAINLPVSILVALEEEIQEYATSKVARAVRDFRPKSLDLVDLFDSMLEPMETEERMKLVEELNALLERAGIKGFHEK